MGHGRPSADFDILPAAAAAAARTHRPPRPLPFRPRPWRPGPPHRSGKHFPVSRLPPSSPPATGILPHCRGVSPVCMLRLVLPLRRGHCLAAWSLPCQPPFLPVFDFDGARRPQGWAHRGDLPHICIALQPNRGYLYLMNKFDSPWQQDRDSTSGGVSPLLLALHSDGRVLTSSLAC